MLWKDLGVIWWSKPCNPGDLTSADTQVTEFC